MEIPLLTTGESKVFCALNDLGESSVGDIIKLAGVSHSKIYDILKRLAKKGLVSSINKNGKQIFSSSEPIYLKELVSEKEKELEDQKKQISEIVKKLEVRRNKSKSKSPLSSFEGLKGVKVVFDYLLKNTSKGSTIYILGSPKRIVEQFGGYLREWQKQRIKKGVICKIITDGNAPSWEDDWWVKSKKNKKTYSKKSSAIVPSYLVITDDIVATIHVSNKILSFIVENEDVALRYKEFFNELWKSNS